MILYCIVCYLIAFGILLEEYDYLEDWKIQDFMFLILAPLLVPVFIGISINHSTKNND